jgi:uncharacterized protein YabE (DUF348 family)
MRRLTGVAASGPILIGALALTAVLTHEPAVDIMLDVAGETQTLSTRAGSVASLLEEHGVDLGPHDVVSHPLDAALYDGAVVSVAFASQVTFEVDGRATTTWTVADAAAALEAMGRTGDARLVPSRHAGRVEIPTALAGIGENVAVVFDGAMRVFPYRGGSIERVLETARAGIGIDDIITVMPADDAGVPAERGAVVAVVIQRVATSVITETEFLDFATEEQPDPNRFTGQSVVLQQGEQGMRTRITRVTTVDGVVTEALELSSAVTAEPVTHIVAVGTQARPVPVWNGGSGGSSYGDDVWAALARCESGGNASIVSSNGLFHGLYQFMVPTWQSVGGSGLPSQASPEEQRYRAERLQARSGWGQWPACARRLGLL